MDMAAFVAGFGQAIEERRATVLVGAGLSRGAGYPDWAGLLSPLCDELGLPALEDLPLLAQYIENTLGRERLVAAVCDAIGSIDPKPTENHRLLAELPIDAVWTTNFDPLVEMASDSPVLVELDEHLVDADGSRRRIYKMHGSIGPGAAEPEGGIDKLVISRDDFDQYERDHPRFWRLLQADFLTRSFLFLGFSLSDPNFAAVRKMVHLTTPDRQMRHYAVLRREGVDFDLRVEDLARVGVEVVEIAEHDEIPELLRSLIARTRPCRLFISGSQQKARGALGSGTDGGRYPAATELSGDLLTIAQELGRRLAATGIQVATASLLGAEVGYALLDELGADYEHQRMLLIRREKQCSVDPPNRRRGQITFVGHDPADMRAMLYAEVRAVVVLAGGSGTRTEVEQTRDADMGIVPIARTGGAARDLWDEMSSALADHQLGGQPIDAGTFERLNDVDHSVAIDAAVELIRQAMYLPAASA
jgi:predicted Rossmann-fold nucleotide-binding protein